MRSRTLWIVAAVLTLACAAYQRVTGPTWPARGSVELAGEEIRYRLPRSHAGPGDAAIAVRAPADARGTLSFRRHATNDAWTRVAMLRRGDELAALLPHQPPAGKLDYSIFVIRATEGVALGGPITLRFRGDVPPWVLVPHILLMFLGMLWATRAGLEKLASEPRYAGLIVWTLILLGVGGLLLGPAVQKFSFGEWWTGWPYGTDLDPQQDRRRLAGVGRRVVCQSARTALRGLVGRRRGRTHPGRLRYSAQLVWQPNPQPVVPGLLFVFSRSIIEGTFGCALAYSFLNARFRAWRQMAKTERTRNGVSA